MRKMGGKEGRREGRGPRKEEGGRGEGNPKSTLLPYILPLVTLWRFPIPLFLAFSPARYSALAGQHAHSQRPFADLTLDRPGKEYPVFYVIPHRLGVTAQA